MSPTDSGASLCVITKPRERGSHSPRWAAEPEKVIIINENNIYMYIWIINVTLKLYDHYIFQNLCEFSVVKILIHMIAIEQ
jgi:hypothetical protein